MKEPQKHADLPVEMTWDLTKMYPTNEDWEKDFRKIDGLVRKFQKFKGHLADSPATLAKAFQAEDELSFLLEKLHTFAHLRSDEDTGISENRGRVDRILAKSAEIEGDTAWFEPEIMKIDKKEFRKLAKAPELKFYALTMKRLEADRPHTLSEAEERVLGLSGEVFGGPYKTFSVMNDADLKFPVIKDAAGADVRLTHGNYIKLLESADRNVRRDAFKGLYSVYGQFKNTFAAILDTAVKSHVVDAKLHKFKSALEASLFEDAVPVSVYESLISTVHDSFTPLYDYFKFRAKRLGLKKLDMYDIHCPLVPDAAMEVEWKDAVQYVKEALRPLGKTYGSILDKAFKERWIDIPEAQGKRSGAYSSGCYRFPPYLLLNYSGNLDSVFTLAHELGHSLHSYFSDHANDYHYAGYKIFVAEVASTTNEILLQRYMVANTADPARKAYLLNHLIDTIRGTLFRQTMFAEFERDIHKMAEAGEPLTADTLSKHYFELNKLYHGPGVNPDDDIRYEWARIPHFHYDFYVYKYATGISAALALSKKILDGETEGYLRFLKAGDSKEVIDIMKDAGVDFTTPAPVQDAMTVFAEQVKELKKCLK